MRKGERNRVLVTGRDRADRPEINRLIRVDHRIAVQVESKLDIPRRNRRTVLPASTGVQFEHDRDGILEGPAPRDPRLETLVADEVEVVADLSEG